MSDSNIYGGFYFNPRPRKEGDYTSFRNGRRSGSYFNPRPRKEGDTFSPCQYYTVHSISIHALAKRATINSDPEQFYMFISIPALAKWATTGDQFTFDGQLISIHALAKRATDSGSNRGMPLLYFNPRPRKESDELESACVTAEGISIHALAKRATWTKCDDNEYTRISIHALAKRATERKAMALAEKAISIHALAKRATYAEHSCFYAHHDFNPRPRKEGDDYADYFENICREFQSTPSQRGRRLALYRQSKPQRFQSTPSQRGRPDITDCLHSRSDVFQSTPSQRGRLAVRVVSRQLASISIHALAKRATRETNKERSKKYISIHALAKRATSPDPTCRTSAYHFNPRPRKEGDRSEAAGGKGRTISIHALAKRATSGNV